MKKIVALLLAFVMVLALCGCDSSDYKKAVQLYEEGKYDEAHAIFVELMDYKDSQIWAENCLKGKLYVLAVSHYENENYKEALNIFESLGEFEDSSNYSMDIRTNNKILFTPLEGKWEALAGFVRGYSYYYFDAESKTLNLYFNNNTGLEWTRTCDVVPTGDRTFYLTNLEEFGSDFGDVSKVECEVSPDGTLITTNIPCCSKFPRCFHPHLTGDVDGKAVFLKFDTVT